MPVIEVRDESFAIDDELYERFALLTGPATEPVSEPQLEGLCAQCGDDDNKIVDLYKFVMLVRLMKPSDARVVAKACPRYRREELMRIVNAGRTLRTAA